MATGPPDHLLVVDASDAMRALLERELAQRGYDVVTAADGEHALALVAERRPDAILLDHELPGLSGLEILARLRADDRLAAVPVIMLTSEHEPALLLTSLRAGAHDHLRKPFDPAELEARVAAALRVKKLNDALVDANRRLAEQALTDHLTGLANRRHGAHELERAVALAVRHGQALALARIDVDHFKSVNDTHGHQTGDEVLAEVAGRLLRAVRGGDELARWGGDEFVVIQPATERGGAARAAERLCAAVASAPVAALDVTVSVGWAHWAGDTPDDLLARADRALYRAKAQGRNTIFPPAPE
jgi:diguanylate cyclase (GGDEF)-like protein